MNNRKEIVICLGSSCFSRGNRKCLSIIEKFLKDHKLEDKYFFRGSRCFDKCEKGPILKIGDVIYESVRPEDLEEILKKSLM
ncbi:MAG: NAD(P)H-dependent oxidoreductase subunit E [Bacteroidales bacterium]